MKRIFLIAVAVFFGTGLLYPQPSKPLANLIQSASLIAEKEEEPLVKTIALFQSEIEKFNAVEQAIVNSMIAECLWGYLQQNRWEIFERTPLANPDLTDIRTWDTRLLLQQTIACYQASLKPREALQNLRVRDYEDILVLGDNESEIQRPTMFDLLAHRAINAWNNHDIRLTQSLDQFLVDNPQFLLPSNVFAALKISDIDTLSLDYQILKTYQLLSQFHTKENNPNIIIPLDLQRMAWIREKAVFENTDSLYQFELEKFLWDFPNSDVTPQIFWTLMMFHAELGSRYDNLISEDYRWNLQKARVYGHNLLDRYPETSFGRSADELLEQMEQPKISLRMQEVILPNQHNLFLMECTNIDAVYFSLYRLSDNELKDVNFTQNRKEFFETIATKNNFFREWKTGISNPGDFQTHRVELSLDPLPTGYYILFASPQFSVLTVKDDNFLVSQVFGVSELSYVTNSESGKLEGVVLNRKTGKPVSGVNVRLFSRTYDWRTRQENTKELAMLKSAKNGRFEYQINTPNGESVSVDLQHKSDVLLSLNNENHWMYRRPERTENWQRQRFLFTDRAIYRPGQIVYFKGILAERKGDSTRVVPNLRVTIKLFDANHKEVSSVEVRANEFGSFSGNFVLPSRGLNGHYSLRWTDDGSQTLTTHFFSVEEYKRPSFEIVFDPLTNSHQLDQEAIVSGVVKTYSGANLGNSFVNYRIVRTVRIPTWRSWWNFRMAEETVISQGVATTDEEGKFQILFTAHSDRRISRDINPTYTFTVTVESTDVAGETQSNTQRIPISHTALNVSLKGSGFLDKTKDSVLYISSTNLSHERINSKGTIKVFYLQPNHRLIHDRQWIRPNMFAQSEAEFISRFPNHPFNKENEREHRKRNLIFEKKYDTEHDEKFVLNGLQRWQTGEYVYTIETQDVFGNAVTNEGFFTVFSPKSEKKNPLKKFYYTIVPNNFVELGGTFSFIVGSASKIDIFYEIRGKNGVLEHRMISLNNEQRRIDFPIKEEHRGNLSLQVWCVVGNRHYSSSETILVPFSNRTINISFETFRDKLMPNTEEKWTLNLLSNDKKPLQGELLLGMYDASLDVFRKNNWTMNLNRFFSPSSSWQTRNFQVRNSQQIKSPDVSGFSTPTIKFDRLNFEPPFFSRRIRSLMRTSSVRYASVEQAEVLNEVQMVGSLDRNRESFTGGLPMTKATADVFLDVEDAAGFSGTEEIAAPEMLSSRTNLNETAFFFPHLRSDENGKVSASFIVPESLTRWRIQGLAHTKDLKVGINEWSAVTQKNLMIHPNMPRFLREGDAIKFQARVVNLQNESIAGEASLCWTLANQFGPISAEERWAKNFEIAPLQNTSVVWAHRVNTTGFLNLNFSAKAGNHTDGEVRTVPVLSNRAMLTETLPMFANAKSERSFTFAKLANPNSTTLENHRLTLEIATNPIWFAVQALPELSSPNNENSIALFGAFFSNAMAIDILNRNPEIKEVFNRWKMVDNAEAEHALPLQSNLETNQELKSVLLDETPWLLQAENETRKKQNIALYFDENNVRNLQSDVLQRLQKLQLPNGGFTWFAGGRGDLWSTQYIVQGLQRLHSRNIERDNFELKNILQNAIKFCDEQHIERLKGERSKVKITLLPNDVHYLYLRKYFETEYPVSPELKEVLDVYDSLAKTNWRTQSRYLQGVLALYFDLKNEKKFVDDIMQNFQRLALKSPEFGMWWRSEPSWFWWEAPIETQAQLIETFSKLGRTDDVDQMKQWLLSQKRTTSWRTPKASSEAVYALLSCGKGEACLALTENTQVEIQIGNEKITTPNTADAGSGYFTRFWTADKMNANQSKITIKNQGNSMVWGGLYWQYFENLDKVTPAKTPLSVKKELFVERTTDRGFVLESVSKNDTVRIGDKVVVRMEIRTDRDLDFVHLKDLRAAAFEPIDVRSGYNFQGGLFYYQDIKDVSMNYYFTRLSRGTYVFEYRVNVSQIGNFSNGYTTIQCLYAPEFSAQSQGERVIVN